LWNQEVKREDKVSSTPYAGLVRREDWETLGVAEIAGVGWPSSPLGGLNQDFQNGVGGSF